MAVWTDGLPGGTDIEGGAVALTATAASTSSTNIRVTFSAPVKDNGPLSALSSYSTSPSLDISAVTPEDTANPNYADLTTEEQKQGVNYTVSIHLVEAA